jgi:hypothetical protein
MINWKKEYYQVITSGDPRGVSFMQNQKYYNRKGEEITRDGRIIEYSAKKAFPDELPVEPEPVKESPPAAVEKTEETVFEVSIPPDGPKAPEQNEAVDSNEDDGLMLIDRLKIIDKNMNGYLEADEIKEELDRRGVKYHYRAGRKKLLSLLVESMGL